MSDYQTAVIPLEAARDTALGRALTLKSAVEQLIWLCQQDGTSQADIGEIASLSRHLAGEVGELNRRIYQAQKLPDASPDDTRRQKEAA